MTRTRLFGVLAIVATIAAFAFEIFKARSEKFDRSEILKKARDAKAANALERSLQDSPDGD